MECDEFTIGEMARLNCITEAALRHYEKLGLIAPSRVNGANGYRYYTMDQCSTIDWIQEMQILGFSLAEIREITRDGNPIELEKALAKRIDDIDAQMAALRRARRVGQVLTKNSKIYRAHPATGEIIVETLPEKAIYFLGVHNPALADPSLSGDELLVEWERHLRAVKRMIIEQGLPLTLFHNVSTFIGKEDLEQGQRLLQDTFVFVDRSLSGLFKGSDGDCMPAGKYLTMYDDSLVDDCGRYSAPINVQKILDYADENGYALAGNYYGIVLAETPGFQYKGRDLLYKLSIQVEDKQPC